MRSAAELYSTEGLISLSSAEISSRGPRVGLTRLAGHRVAALLPRVGQLRLAEVRDRVGVGRRREDHRGDREDRRYAAADEAELLLLLNRAQQPVAALARGHHRAPTRLDQRGAFQLAEHEEVAFDRHELLGGLEAGGPALVAADDRHVEGQLTELNVRAAGVAVELLLEAVLVVVEVGALAHVDLQRARAVVQAEHRAALERLEGLAAFDRLGAVLGGLGLLVEPLDLHLVSEAGLLGAGREQLHLGRHHLALGRHRTLGIRGDRVLGDLPRLLERRREDPLALEVIPQTETEHRETDDQQQDTHLDTPVERPRVAARVVWKAATVAACGVETHRPRQV